MQIFKAWESHFQSISASTCMKTSNSDSSTDHQGIFLLQDQIICILHKPHALENLFTPAICFLQCSSELEWAFQMFSFSSY